MLFQSPLSLLSALRRPLACFMLLHLIAAGGCTKNQATLELMTPTTSAESVEALGSITLSAPLKTANIDSQSLSYEWRQILPQSPQGTFSAVSGSSKKEQISWMAPEVTESKAFTLQVIAQSQDGKTSNAATVSVVVNPHEAACKGSCSDPANAICVDQSCAPCKSDDECADWADRRRNDRKLCINRVCRECRSATDCTDSGKPNCEANISNQPTANLCFGCKQDSECPTQLCKKDEAMSDKPANIGACVQESEIVYVNNATLGCKEKASGTISEPFCEVGQAVENSGKSYIKVIGSAHPYPVTTINKAGVHFIIIGAGRDQNAPASKIQGIIATDSAQVTLQGMQIFTNNGAGTAASCQQSAHLYLRDVFIGPSNTGIEANCTRLWMENSRIELAEKKALLTKGNTLYRVVNNVMMFSGTVAAPFGVELSGASSGYFAFNTVVKNYEGISCSNGQRISDSIVSSNQSGQVEGSCVQVRIATDLTVNAGSAASPSEPTVTGDTGWVNQASAADVEAERLLQNSPQHAPVTDDYHHTPRPKGSAYDLGHNELK